MEVLSKQPFSYNLLCNEENHCSGNVTGTSAELHIRCSPRLHMWNLMFEYSPSYYLSDSFSNADFKRDHYAVELPYNARPLSHEEGISVLQCYLIHNRICDPSYKFVALVVNHPVYI
ncbi:hypothetical protein NPIL_213141 [Nephila pilipes]|uniref:Uncharacterized protein n=1 Tax=Nephila pilipes TaxID=299642 RepID=A0A8X6QTW4_NEPPI|nr:hypothetical protein NPIL_213141 [Nephila pilipes]